MKRAVYVVGTLDTKGHEMAYLRDLIQEAGVPALLVDVGTALSPQVQPGITREMVAGCLPDEKILGLDDRGQAVTAMAKALRIFLINEEKAGSVAGVIGAGGTGGTALLAPALQALPIGLPKVLVSTVASGNTLPYVGTADIVMINSVVDVAGLNAVSRRVLGNAAHAMAGMARAEPVVDGTRPVAALTMFGVTTPCVNEVRRRLTAANWDCLVFHATGTGGRAMEKLAASGLVEGLLDLTTTEVADEIVGGVFRAGPDRFEVLARRAIPCVMSLGALDMVNFGAMDSVPPQFRDRLLHVHNSQVTLMRTTPGENCEFARWMASRLNRALGSLTLFLPEGGLSALDAPGQPFYDPEADAALFDELEKNWQVTARHKLIRLPHHINSPEFALAVAEEFQRLSS